MRQNKEQSAHGYVHDYDYGATSLDDWKSNVFVDRFIPFLSFLLLISGCSKHKDPIAFGSNNGSTVSISGTR